ncbi:hypothetical protein [Actinoplanes missouriensis]|nr:hypothetical protein [Actinoplanes missouriensis]
MNGEVRSKSAAVQCALFATGMTAGSAALLFLGVLAGGGLEVAYTGGAVLGIGSLILYGTALWLRLTGAPQRNE